MKKIFNALLILILMSAASANLLKASGENPDKVNGDCSECMKDQVYLRYFKQAEAGSMVATYQATAALIQCYIKNGCFGNSTGYSYDDLIKMYNENMETIKELGSEQPYIKLPDSEPDNSNKNYDSNNSNDDSGDGRISVRSAK